MPEGNDTRIGGNRLRGLRFGIEPDQIAPVARLLGPVRRGLLVLDAVGKTLPRLRRQGPTGHGDQHTEIGAFWRESGRFTLHISVFDFADKSLVAQPGP